MTQQEAEARGIDLQFSDAQQKQENQIAAVRSFIAQGVDAILLAPVVATGWDAVLEEAAEAEIPVVLLDRMVDSDPSLYLTAVGSDLVHEGEVAGQWLVGPGGRGALPRGRASGHDGLVARHRPRPGLPERHRGPRQHRDRPVPDRRLHPRRRARR